MAIKNDIREFLRITNFEAKLKIFDEFFLALGLLELAQHFVSRSK